MRILSYVMYKIFSRTTVNWFWCVGVGCFLHSKWWFQFLFFSFGLEPMNAAFITSMISISSNILLAYLSMRSYLKRFPLPLTKEQKSTGRWYLMALYGLCYLPAFMFNWRTPWFIPLMTLSLAITYWKEDKFGQQIIQERLNTVKEKHEGKK